MSQWPHEITAATSSPFWPSIQTDPGFLATENEAFEMFVNKTENAGSVAAESENFWHISCGLVDQLLDQVACTCAVEEIWMFVLICRFYVNSNLFQYIKKHAYVDWKLSTPNLCFQIYLHLCGQVCVLKIIKVLLMNHEGVITSSTGCWPF